MKHRVIIVGIAGASGSGKSLLANTIVDELGSDRVTVLSEDRYYKDLEHLPLKERASVNFDHPDAFDHELLYQHLKELQDGRSIQVPVYDFVNHCRSKETRPIGESKSIIVLEGIMLFVEPRLREMMDILIYVDTPPDISFIRRLERDVVERGRVMETVIHQYIETVRPMYVKFIEPSKRYADLIVPHGGKNRIAIELIQAKLKELLARA